MAAASSNATAAQRARAGGLQRPGQVAIPKAGSVANCKENAKSLKIRLTDEDMVMLDNTYPAPKRKIPLEVL